MAGDLIQKSFSALKALASRTVTIECDGIPYQFCDVPVKKILNWILVEASIFLKPARPWGWPTHLQVEPTNLCNLRCALCYVTEGLRRSSGHMSLDTFRRVIDEIGDYVYLILLWDWGEPFLNPSVYDMIAYAKEHSIKVVSSGHIFATGDHAERLVRSGIDSLIFAVDGITQETYERYRGDGNLDAVIAGIKRVVAVKRALNTPTPLINFRFIVMRHNEHEIPMLEDFARPLGVDALTLKTLNPYCGESDSEDELVEALTPETSVYQRFEHGQDRPRIRRERNPCKDLWNNPTIHWNGKVCPCTFDPHDEHVLGDLTQDTFKDIWMGEPYRRLRRQFRKAYQEIDVCSECTFAFEGGALSTETIVGAQFFGSPTG